MRQGFTLKEAEGHEKLEVTTQQLKLMSNSTLLYGQLLGYLRQHSRYCDLRHLKALGWMVSGLIDSGQLSLAAWELYVPARAPWPSSHVWARRHVFSYQQTRQTGQRLAISGMDMNRLLQQLPGSPCLHQ